MVRYIYEREQVEKATEANVVYKLTGIRITSVPSIQSTKIRKYHPKSNQYKVQI